MLVRFIAAALIGWAVVEVSLYLVICRHNLAPVKFFPCAVRGLPLAAGVALLVRAKSVARWLAEKLED